MKIICGKFMKKVKVDEFVRFCTRMGFSVAITTERVTINKNDYVSHFEITIVDGESYVKSAESVLDIISRKQCFKTIVNMDLEIETLETAAI